MSLQDLIEFVDPRFRFLSSRSAVPYAVVVWCGKADMVWCGKADNPN